MTPFGGKRKAVTPPNRPGHYVSEAFSEMRCPERKKPKARMSLKLEMALTSEEVLTEMKRKEEKKREAEQQKKERAEKRRQLAEERAERELAASREKFERAQAKLQALRRGEKAPPSAAAQRSTPTTATASKEATAAPPPTPATSDDLEYTNRCFACKLIFTSDQAAMALGCDLCGLVWWHRECVEAFTGASKDLTKVPLKCHRCISNL